MAAQALAQAARLRSRVEAALAAVEDRGGAAPEPERDPAAWYEGLTGRALDPWQRAVLTSASQRLLLVCGRQSGKTEVVAARAAHGALRRGRRVGILSPTYRQSLIVYRRVRRLLVLAGAGMARDTAGLLELPHGGAVLAFPGDDPDKAVRGETLQDLIVDEAGIVRDDVITAAAPTLATVADHTEVHLGTPKGQRGTFWKEWSAGEGWERHTARSDQCPRISAQYLERMRVRLGPLYRQEFLCEFLAAPGGVLDPERLDELFGGAAGASWPGAGEVAEGAQAW
jgi:hypothetical protein